jgi:hypothetical protein
MPSSGSPQRRSRCRMRWACRAHACRSSSSPWSRARPEGVHDLAVDVDLQLVGRCVADADRVRPVVTGQPVQRPQDGLAVGPVVGGPGGPVGPEPHGRGQCAPGVGRSGDRQVRREPPQDEGHAVTGRHGCVGVRGEVVPVGGHVGVQRHRVGPADSDHLTVHAVYPRDRPAVVESQPQFTVNVDASGDALDDADHVVRSVAGRHEVRHADGPVRGVPFVLEDQRLVAVPTTVGIARPGRRDLPVSVPFVAKQRGEAGRGVEAGQTQPVDRSVVAHQRRGVQIPDQTVIL